MQRPYPNEKSIPKCKDHTRMKKAYSNDNSTCSNLAGSRPAHFFDIERIATCADCDTIDYAGRKGVWYIVTDRREAARGRH